MIAQLSRDSLELRQNRLRQTIGIDSISAFQMADNLINEARKANLLEYEALAYFHLGSFYIQNNEFEKSEKYLFLSDSISKSLEFTRGVIWTQIRRGYLYHIQGKENKFCDSIFDDAVLLANETNDSLMIVEALNGKANILQYEYSQGLKILYQALKIAENNHFEYQIAYLKNNIGNIKLANDQFEEARKDFEESLKIAEKLGEVKLSMHASHNLALVYMSLKQNDQALPALEKVKKYAQKINLMFEYTLAVYNISRNYIEKNDNQTALKHLEEASKIAEQYKFTILLSKIYLLYSELYLSIQHLEKSKTNAFKALTIAKENKFWDDAASCAQNLSEIFEKQKQFDKAILYRDYFKSFSDSVHKYMKTKEFHELQFQYNVEKKERELTQEKTRRLEAEQAKERQTFFWISLLVVVGALFVILGQILYIRYIKKMNETQAKFSQELIFRIDEERTRIARDMHDEIGQILSFIKNKMFLNQQIQPELMSELMQETSKVIDRVREIARDLHPSFLSSITLKEALTVFLKSVQKEMNILTTLDAIDVDPLMTYETKIHLYRIIQELVTNTVKHAQASSLKVNLKKINGDIMLIYQDNGIGLQSSNPTKNFGMLNVMERIKILKGNFVSESAKGVKFVIKFPTK